MSKLHLHRNIDGTHALTRDEDGQALPGVKADWVHVKDVRFDGVTALIGAIASSPEIEKQLDLDGVFLNGTSQI